MRFVLVDRIVSLEPGRRIVASTVFDPALPLFQDHFPGHPVVPGTLLTEAIAQCGGWLIAAAVDFSSWPLLVMVDRARFHRAVAPGQTLTLEATVRSSRAAAWEIIGRVHADGTPVAEARLLFHLFTFPASADTGAGDWGRALFARLGGPAALDAARPTERLDAPRPAEQ